MAVSLELIESIRERAHVSYEEAKETLEKCNNDIVEALIYLEKQNKIKAPLHDSTAQSGLWVSIKKLVRTCNTTRLIISKNGKPIIDLSLTVVILATIIALPLTIIGLLAALFTNHKIRLEKPGCDNMKINKTLDNISSAASKVSEQVADAINKN
ncbi:MAG: DUF4342 domain-containing protein [Syntrophomonas sp.]|nr:DUF4342 domain-containing protein [Syntrophomonas sp.]